MNPSLKGVIYYTDNNIQDPIRNTVMEYIEVSNLPITSASLKPIDFGENEVIDMPRGYPAMVNQIISCLERNPAKYVFFCEHDVLYPKSHFDFTPDRDDVFYYNENAWRWWLGSEKAIRHDRMLSLSCLCANRELALDNYKKRLEVVSQHPEGEEGEPQWVRAMGYEPGTKKKKRGGITDEDFSTWSSEVPVIDIRHKGTFSPAKLKEKDFKHAPKWFEEVDAYSIEGWDLERLFP